MDIMHITRDNSPMFYMEDMPYKKGYDSQVGTETTAKVKLVSCETQDRDGKKVMSCEYEVLSVDGCEPVSEESTNMDDLDDAFKKYEDGETAESKEDSDMKEEEETNEEK